MQPNATPRARLWPKHVGASAKPHSLPLPVPAPASCLMSLRRKSGSRVEIGLRSPALPPNADPSDLRLPISETQVRLFDWLESSEIVRHESNLSKVDLCRLKELAKICDSL